MNVFVTGGAGRIGSQVIADLVARSDHVTSFDLCEVRRPHPHVTAVLGTFDDTQAVAQAMEHADAVLHLGAMMSWVAADTPRMFAANVTGTHTLLQAARSRRIRKFVFASSGEVYPETRPLYLPLDESHPTQPTSAYGLTKLLGEEMVQFFARAHGLATVILRFSHTQDAAELLDPGSFFSGPRFFLRPRIRQQDAFGNTAVAEVLRAHDDGTEKHLISRGQDGTLFRMPITDTRDIAAGVVAALDSDRACGQVLNLGTEGATRIDHAVALLQRHTGLPAVDVTLPIPAVNYETSRARAIEVLGIQPQWTFARMVEDAARQPA